MGPNDPDPTYTPSLLERYGQCEADIHMLQAMLKGFAQDEHNLGLNLGEVVLRSIRRAEEEREEVREEYEQKIIGLAHGPDRETEEKDEGPHIYDPLEDDSGR